MQLFALSQGVANLEDAIIGQSHNITRPRLINGRLALCHKLCRRGETERFSLTNMQVGLITLELTATHLTESDARTMVRVDISRYLEDETRKLWFLWLYHTFFCLCRLRTGGYLNKAVEQFLYAEIIEC